MEEYETIEELAQRSSCPEYILRLLCEKGKMQGAILEGDTWIVPKKFIHIYRKPSREEIAAARKWQRELKDIIKRKDE